MVHKRSFLLVILASASCVCGIAHQVPARDTDALSRHATYIITGAEERSSCIATRMEMDVRKPPREEGALWEMTVTLENGRVLTVRALSERAPMMSPEGPGRFLHYAYRTAEGEGYEYVDEETGGPVLPGFDFVNQFLPTPAEDAVYAEGFAASGQFLGHLATLESVELRDPPPKWKHVELLNLHPDLLIGTSRTVRDDGTGQDDHEEYRYIPFVEEDYDEMIDAGINYFGVKADQLQYVRDREVYWRYTPVFPDDFYRSNFVGIRMFTDEPMVRMGWQGVLAEDLVHPHQVTAALVTRIEAMYADNGAQYGVEKAVKQQGIDLGTMRLYREEVPTWETVYESAFYELAGGAPGIVHEGRYVMPEGYGWHPSAILGTGLEMTPEEMLRCYYAFLRGAARAYDGQWGTAIYGQSDPDIRQTALNLAYDMGAKYCWFWTSDHNHHVPYTEQLSLTRGLMKHAKENPRPSLEKLRDAATTAIAFPMGYSVSWGRMWGKHTFANERATREGAFYREVAANGLWEGILCAKRGIDFDFTVDHDGLDDLGYERIVRIGEDASVTVWPRPVETEVPYLEVLAEVSEPVGVDIPEEATRTVEAAYLTGRQMKIDGSLAEWPRTEGFSLSGPPVEATGWNGIADLSGDVVFGYDDANFYVGATVRDDVQNQGYRGWSLWKGDSVQIGLDPLNERATGDYAINMHEIGFALVDRRPVCWRWFGREGQPREELTSADVAIIRDEYEGTTTYEAAIPLSELTPLLPEVFEMAGVAVVINDADSEDRESYLESAPGALTAGKHPDRFASLLFEPSPPGAGEAGNPIREWAALVWQDTVLPEGGMIDLDLYSIFRDGGDGAIKVRISPAGSTHGKPGETAIAFSGPTEPGVSTLTIAPKVPAGQYRLEVTVLSEEGRIVTRDGATVYVYPVTSSQ